MGFNCFANQETRKNFQLSKGFCQLGIYTITQIALLVNNGLVIRKNLQNMKPSIKKLGAQIQMCVKQILNVFFMRETMLNVHSSLANRKTCIVATLVNLMYSVAYCRGLQITNTLLKSL